jgi:hypothetical protein
MCVNVISKEVLWGALIIAEHISVVQAEIERIRVKSGENRP